MDVEVDYQAVVDYIDAQYAHVSAVYDEALEVSGLISLVEFRAVMLAALGKRIQWVRSKVNGVKEGQTIRVDNHLPLPGPLFDLFYAFGRVVSSSNGTTFLPAFPEDLRKQVSVEIVRKYMIYHSRLKHYYSFSEALPSQIDGSWAYLIYADDVFHGVALTAMSDEPKPADAYLAAAIRCARVVAGYPYNITYGILPNPEVIRTSIFDAYGKGIGDAR